MRLKKPSTEASQAVMMSSILPPLSFQMKENCTMLHQGTAVATTGELQSQNQQHLVPTRLLPVNQLPCKENVGQALSSHPMTRSRRLQQQQLCELQCNEMEVLGDCISGGVVVGVDSLNPPVHPYPSGQVIVGDPTSIPAPLDYITTQTGSTTGYDGFSMPETQPPPSVAQTILPNKPPGFDYHRTVTTAATAPAIQQLQGGSLHITHAQQPATVRGFGTGGSGTFTPLPNLQWTQASDLWRRMRLKDVTKVAPETDLRILHPGILPSMRVILLDWMMEV